MLMTVTEKGFLKAVSKPQEESDVFIIAVPTPFKKSNTQSDELIPDISFIESAIDSILPILKKGNLIIIESTSPVGTTDYICEYISKKRDDLKLPNSSSDNHDIYIAYCPERVLPGKILDEIVMNDRVIGGISSRCADMASEIYKIFLKGKINITDSKTAEMAKLTENAYRDVNIAFANELSMICDKHDINVWELIKLSNKHPRVNILKPGPGVGGHCIAVDPWFIVSGAKNEAKLIKKAREINDSKPGFVIAQVNKIFEDFHSPIIACLGITFKADIDDLRESPSLDIVYEITQNEKVDKVFIVEPNISDLPNNLNGNKKCELVDLDYALEKADIVLLLVDHKEFLSINKDVLNSKEIIDTRGIL